MFLVHHQMHKNNRDSDQQEFSIDFFTFDEKNASKNSYLSSL
jgi:hypothetical protein